MDTTCIDDIRKISIILNNARETIRVLMYVLYNDKNNREISYLPQRDKAYDSSEEAFNQINNAYQLLHSILQYLKEVEKNGLLERHYQETNDNVREAFEQYQMILKLVMEHQESQI